MSTYTGLCIGGPMAGQQGESRFPRGFVLAKKDQQVVWIYDYEDGQFFVRQESMMDTLDPDKLAKAAAEPKYDVRAYDPEVMG